MDKHYLGILLVNDPTPHIENTNVTWRFDPNVFKFHMDIWKKYMNFNENILTIIVQGHRDIPIGTAMYDSENQILKVHMTSEHTYEHPSCAIHVTLEMFEAINSNFKYDFLIRSTTSSFWVFERLEKLLNTLPKSKVYKGTKMFHDENAISGSGFILSKDVVEIIIKGKNVLKHTLYWDDVIFSRYALIFDIPLEDMEICNIENIDNLYDSIENADKKNVCQFKVKNLKNRFEYDRFVLNILYDRYYGKTNYSSE